MRVIRAFQAGINSTHPSSLTATATDRLRQSYRRLRIAKERELERINQLRASGQTPISETQKSPTGIKFV
uniref:Uncharacterized protein n=1 Tax=Panagrolaimus davidi TaxID=227884 RepID=A0A914PXI7_9BILA